MTQNLKFWARRCIFDYILNKILSCVILHTSLVRLSIYQTEDLRRYLLFLKSFSPLDQGVRRKLRETDVVYVHVRLVAPIEDGVGLHCNKLTRKGALATASQRK